jgi:peptidoglycan/LPS O-acetylase OafA/YrhL
MIQRIQSIWLLLTAVVTGLLFKVPVYGGKLGNETTREMLIGQNYLLMIVAAVLVIIPAVAIFFFKNRSTQKKLIWVSILLQIVFVVLVWMEATTFSDVQQFVQESYQLGAILPIVAIIFLILAYRGISHDEKLIRSADRLR